MLGNAWRLTSRKRKDSVTAPLARPFWAGLTALVVSLLLTAHPQNIESILGAAMIIAGGFLPSAIWILKRLGGLPVFPVFAAMHVWAFGIPLLYEHPIVTRFQPDQQLFAAMSVAGFLLLGTLVWHQMRLRSPKAPRACFALESRTAETVFLLVLTLSIVYTTALNAGWLSFIPAGVFSIVRSVMLALEALSCFVLSYRLGCGELKFGQASLFKVLFVALLVVGLPTLYLVTPISLLGIAALGYISASGRIPWVSLVLAVLVISFLHAGKGDMRDRYWGEQAEGTVQPWDYPVFFGDWTSSSVDGLFGNIPDEDEKSSSLVERSSLMQLLLYEQVMSPDHIPFMWGETYVIVPELLIPRILFSEKPTTHEGTYRLSIHYGLQTREETENTTIGFGLLNESYANFGFFGMAGLAVILGAFYGYVEGLALSVPLLSLRSLFVVIVACYAFQVEFAAGVWASALFQSTVALLGLSAVLMKSKRLQPAPVAVPTTSGLQPVRG
jgi:hypothetical protein